MGYPSNWTKCKEEIMKRDNYVCLHCGMSVEQHIEKYRVRLHIDHIDGNKENNTDDNLQTLCAKCHRAKDAKRLKAISTYKPFERFVFQVTKEQHKKLKEVALEQGTSVSYVVRSLIIKQMEGGISI